MTRNGRTMPFPNELRTPPICRSHTSRGSCGSKARSARTVTGRGYSRIRDGPLVDDATRAELEARELRLSVLRRDAARDERARAGRTGGRRLEAPPRAPGVRP